MVTKEQILEALKECCFDILNYDNYEQNIVNYMDSKVLDEYNSGASKVVLFPTDEETDFVVKIPFSHDAERISWYEDREDFNPEEALFVGADEPNGWDYCKAETIYYEHAVEEGLEFAFLKTELIGYSDDFHPIYIQKKAEMLEIREESHKKDWAECQLASNFCTSNHLECFSGYWVADFLNCYGEEAYRKLHDFLADFHIWDMHSGNLGYYKGKPVVVDYGGYHE
jgi:hypothetical protein